MEERQEKSILGYSEEKMTRNEIGNFRTFEYHFPFNYENINVVRKYSCGETHGMELNSVNSYWPENTRRPSDYIEISEDQPIAYVEVIGSACTPPGFVMLSATPVDGFRRHDEIDDIMPVRFRIGNLWGMHMRADQWMVRDTEVPSLIKQEPYSPVSAGFIEKFPECSNLKMKSNYREVPLTGMSCALFSIPLSRAVKVIAGSEILGWPDDNFPDDVHYSIRMIRITVCDIISKERCKT
jgi:hypothetical protein